MPVLRPPDEPQHRLPVRCTGRRHSSCGKHAGNAMPGGQGDRRRAACTVDLVLFVEAQLEIRRLQKPACDRKQRLHAVLEETCMHQLAADMRRVCGTAMERAEGTTDAQCQSAASHHWHGMAWHGMAIPRGRRIEKISDVPLASISEVGVGNAPKKFAMHVCFVSHDETRDIRTQHTKSCHLRAGGRVGH